MTRLSWLGGFRVMALACLLAACQPAPTHTAAAPVAAAGASPATAAPMSEDKPPRYFSLALVGYNYTDRHIDTFEVNGQGGGNLGISTPTAGGGSSMCCVGWLEGSELPRKVTVKWAASYCMQRDVTSAGEAFVTRQPILHIADVQFAGPVPDKPAYFEVHFFPDGHIEVAMTEKTSPPRLILQSTSMGYRPGIVINDPPCAPNYQRINAFNQPIRVNATKR